MSRETKIADMREVLQFLEDNPKIPMPYFGMVDVFVREADDVDGLARAMAPCNKKVGGSYFSLTRAFGSVSLEVNFDREQVCERIVTGSKDIPEKTIEAHTEDIVEWKCPDGVLRQA
jgi:hypothetical protein